MDAGVIAVDLHHRLAHDRLFRVAQVRVHRAVAAVHARRHDAGIVLVDRRVHPGAVEAVPPALDHAEVAVQLGVLERHPEVRHHDVVEVGGHARRQRVAGHGHDLLLHARQPVHAVVLRRVHEVAAVPVGADRNRHLPAVESLPPQVDAGVIAVDLHRGVAHRELLRVAKVRVHRAVAAAHAVGHDVGVVRVDRRVHPVAVEVVPPARDPAEVAVQLGVLERHPEVRHHDVVEVGGHARRQRVAGHGHDLLLHARQPVHAVVLRRVHEVAAVPVGADRNRHLPAVESLPPQVDAGVVAFDLLGRVVDDVLFVVAEIRVHGAVAAVLALGHDAVIGRVDRGVLPRAVEAVPPTLDIVERRGLRGAGERKRTHEHGDECDGTTIDGWRHGFPSSRRARPGDRHDGCRSCPDAACFLRCSVLGTRQGGFRDAPGRRRSERGPAWPRSSALQGERELSQKFCDLWVIYRPKMVIFEQILL